jgi:uncharacterized protein (TIGR00369 family)
MEAPLHHPGDGWLEVSDPGFIGYVGPFWTRQEANRLDLGFFMDERHSNRAQRLHGGMIATVADRAMGMAARMHEPNRNHATISLNLSYLDSAIPSEFVHAGASVQRETRSLCFLQCSVFAQDRIIATAQGVWKKL